MAPDARMEDERQPWRVATAPGAGRIEAPDTLRGRAVLVIPVMNIQSLAMIDSACYDPTASINLTGINLAVWLISYISVDMMFLAIFSMLFGAGIVVMSRRVERSGASLRGIHVRTSRVIRQNHDRSRPWLPGKSIDLNGTHPAPCGEHKGGVVAWAVRSGDIRKASIDRPSEGAER